MSEQQYRVHACNNIEPHKSHEFRGTYRKPSLPGVEITETFRCEGIERPVPAGDEPQRRSFIVTPKNDRYDAFDIEDALINSRSFLPEGVRVLPSPHPPPREQIAEAVHEVVENGSWSNADEMEPLIVDAVLALIQNGAER